MPPVVKLGPTVERAVLLLLRFRLASGSLSGCQLVPPAVQRSRFPGELDGGTSSDPGGGSRRVGELSIFY